MSIQETLRKLQAEVAKGMGEGALQKALTTSSNIVNYDLQAPAKNLYPVITPLRNRIPRVLGNGGKATNWKAILGITGSGVSSMGWIPEGQRSGRQNYSAVDKAASYRTLGEEDNITEEAINAAIGFEDAMARMTMRLLQGTMIKEELGILGGNASTSLGTPSTLVSTAPASSATLPTDTYSCQCVALTLEGWIAAGAIQGAAASATLQQAVTVTGADGKSYTINGGSSQISATKTQAITLGQGLGLTVPPVAGAVAYAWFIVGAAGSGVTKLEYITTINSILITTPLAGTGQLNSTITADCSKNANTAFDGLLYSALASGSGAYVNSLATGTAGTGTVLTAGSRRNVNEIDVMLKYMWDKTRISPTVLLVNSQELQNITNKVMNTSAAPILMTNQSDPYAVVGNGQVTGYFNPFTAGQGGLIIPFVLHPNVPPGTILGWCENLPQQYQSNETPNVAEMHVRKEYVQTFWPQMTRTRDCGVYVEETLANYLPAGMGVITNIANG